MVTKSTKAALVPCQGCGRTFNPDRLTVHMRSCKNAPALASSPPSPQKGRPPTMPCYICAREFGTRSIAIHEPQCLKKWQLENDALPQALKRPEPTKPDMAKITGCYICGMQMEPSKRPAHERTCLEEWKQINEERPEGQRLPEPARPDYRFTENGEVDFYGTFNSIWTNHMESLIPCRQCGRKFFPDRILRHEAACVNLPMKSKNPRS